MTGLRRLAAAAMARDLCAFVVPGPDVARSRGLDVAAAGLHLAATPRHANLLLVVGPLPPGLQEAASVAYAQMPRPRAILVLGAGNITPLPPPDATAVLSQAGLAEGIAAIGRAFAAGAFAEDVADFDPPALRTRTQYTCPMHPEVVSDEPGNCPKCGMTLVPKETSATGHSGHAMPAKEPAMPAREPAATRAASHDHSKHAGAEAAHYTCPMHPEVVSDEPGSCPKCGMFLVPVEEKKDGGHSGHEGHGGHDHAKHAGAEAAHYTCPMHPEVVSDEPGNCPKCGMFLVPVKEKKEDGGPSGHEGHGGHDHSKHAGAEAAHYTCPMHPEVISDEPGSCPKCGMFLVPVEEKKDGGHSGHEGHGGNDHSAPGGQQANGEHTGHAMQGEVADGVEAHFMSMVDMTRDMPASPDGLKMEWISVPFGPFFPGLPGGLGLNLRLDGDTVAGSSGHSLVNSDPLVADAPDAGVFADRLAELSPLSPVAMRELVCRGAEAAMGRQAAPKDAGGRAAAVERERIASHLGWLAGFAAQTGMVWLERRAAALQLALRDASAEEIGRRAGSLRALLHRVRATPLLRVKLAGIGRLDGGPTASGPVARAAGQPTDGRLNDLVYAALGFTVVTQSGGDALARLHQRCDEIAQSLDLIVRAGMILPPLPGDATGATGHGMAEVETPRGAASLHLALADGKVTEARVETPFAAQVDLIGGMTAQAELADALVAVGSLDLDPWDLRA